MTDVAAERAILAAATPRPWATSPLVADPAATVIFGPDGDGFVDVLWMAGRDNDPEADAALIVRAVNSYEAMLGLVEAAQRAVAARDEFLAWPDDDRDGLRAALDAVTATLGGEG